MISSIARRLRSDRGEGSAIAVIAGAILFTLASAGLGTFIITSLGASTIAQANTNLTAALQDEILKWKLTPWNQLQEENADEVTITSDGHQYDVIREVTYRPDISSFTIDLAAPRVTMPGPKPVDCTRAIIEPVSGCIAVSANYTATSDDKLPDTPTGVTLVTQQLGSDGQSTNLTPSGNFESGDTAWTLAGGAAVRTYKPAHAQGSHTLAMPDDTAAATLTTPIDVTADDQIQVSLWGYSAGTSGSLRATATWSYPGTTDTTSSLIDALTVSRANGDWALLTGIVSAPAGATGMQIQLNVTASGSCDDGACAWYADDLVTTAKSRNLVPAPGIDDPRNQGQPTVSGAASIQTAPGRSSLSGTLVGQFAGNGAITSGDTAEPAPAGTYKAQVWATTTGDGVAAGNITLDVVDDGGVSLGAVTRSIDGIVAGEWVTITDTITASTAAKLHVVVRTDSYPADPDTVHVDDLSLVQQTSLTASPSSDGYIKLATFDGSAFTDSTAFRSSFAWSGDKAAQPTDLNVGIFCSDAANAFTVSQVRMQKTTSTTGGDWYWARIVLPEVSRLRDCATPVMRIWSQGGNTPTPSDIGEVSILKVLNGVKTEDHVGGY